MAVVFCALRSSICWLWW